jgi:endonuclease VIII
MPEGDTIFRVARTLHRALASKPVTSFETVLPHLDRVNVDRPIVGRTIERVAAQGKWLLVHFSGDLILLTHMLMSGSWHIYRPGERWKRRSREMRIILCTADFVAVAFEVPVAEFHTGSTIRRRRSFSALGPSVLASEFDEAAAAERLRALPRLEVGEALLAQSVVAGIGNIFKCEVCFASGVNPFRRVEMLGTEELLAIMREARRLLSASVTETSGNEIVTYFGLRRTTDRSDPQQNLWVYRRAGEACRKCGAAILSRKQGEGARSTFWCPRCQPLEPVTVRSLPRHEE